MTTILLVLLCLMNVLLHVLGEKYSRQGKASFERSKHHYERTRYWFDESGRIYNLNLFIKRTLREEADGLGSGGPNSTESKYAHDLLLDISEFEGSTHEH